jgi:hypothetical protein
MNYELRFRRVAEILLTIDWLGLTGSDWLAGLDFRGRDALVCQGETQHSFCFGQEAAGLIQGGERLCGSMREMVYQRR